jgi:tetratricopeptide (TPR) repeat protein
MWVDAFQRLAESEWRAILAGLAEVWHQQVARLVPALGSSAEELEGATVAESRLRLFHGVVQTLVHLSHRCSLLLWFDDLHWADEASLELLHYVARQTSGHKLLIVGSFRASAVADNPYLNNLLKGEDPIRTIDLPPLNHDSIRQMLAGLDITGPDDFVDRLCQHSGGNPFFLVETLNALTEAGKLRRVPNGSLVAEKIDPWPLPARVRDLIQSRMVSFSEEERRVLAAAAAIGPPLGLRLLRRVSGLPELRVVETVESASMHGFLTELQDSPPERSLAFVHPYFERVVYGGLGQIQRYALHRRTALALLEIHQSSPQDVAEEVAYHFEQTGDLRAIHYLTEAAQQAEGLYAYLHATNLYTRALAALDRHRPTDSVGRFDLLLRREAMLDRQGRREEQARDVMDLAQLAEAMADTGRQAAAAVRKAGYMTYMGRFQDARKAGESALDLYRQAQDTEGEAQALRELGFLHWSAQDYGAALRYARDVLQLHRRMGDSKGEATALHNLAEIHRSLGSPRQALSQFQAALGLYWAGQDRRRQAMTLYGMAHALRQKGEQDRASSCYEQALGYFEAAGDRLMASRVRHEIAANHWARRELDQAVVQMEQAVGISREIGYGPGIAHGLISLGGLSAQRGQLEAARELLWEALTWLRLTEDSHGQEVAQVRLDELEHRQLDASKLFSSPSGWVKGHVVLAEGKVYCAFESPLAS